MSDTVVIPSGRDKQADFGKYQFISDLGEGAMGKVCKCFDPDFHRMVAIKTIHKSLLNDVSADEFRERFRNEMRAVGKFAHPNIVSVFDAGEKDGCPYFVMEYVDGLELKHMLDAKTPFSIEQSLSIIKGVLRGLSSVHKSGITHRDLKPANIFISNTDGLPKIADFGIAKLDNSDMTQIGTVIGSPKYMSPEQCIGEPVDARADLFAIGIILYELLTGTYCFMGDSTSAISQKIINVEITPPSKLNSNIPRYFDQILKKALAKRADDRFQDAIEFLNALDAAGKNYKEKTKHKSLGWLGGGVAASLIAAALFYVLLPDFGASDKSVVSNASVSDVSDSGDVPANREDLKTLDGAVEREFDTTQEKVNVRSLTPEKSAKLAKLFKVAETYKRIGRLASPSGSNAFDAYKIVLSIDPNNKEALAGIREIEATLLEKARASIESGDTEQAVSLARTGQEIFPDSPGFNDILNRIENRND